jgi:1-acyl-sn-glycerol-3-phosphate acyltransferase
VSRAGALRVASADESALARVARRCATIPLYLALGPLLVALLPLALPLLALHDLARRNRFSTVRSALALAHYALGEALGLVASGALWIAGLVAPERARDLCFQLQCWWARWLFGGARVLFGLRLDVRGVEHARSGPLLLLMRHASVIDTLLPAVLVSSRTGLRLRYVLKRELLWDPCLDVVGQRLPNAFVRRGQGGSEREIARVRELARGLGPRDGVLLFPEGTRYTPRRRQQLIDRLAASAEPKWVERARSMHHVLPPRLGGVLALLESAPEADVVVCAHTGLESLRSLADLWSGALVGRAIEVELWRIPASEVPAGETARVDWLYEQWERVDAWLEARSGRAAADVA